MGRRFRASNYQSTTRVKPFNCSMPMRLDDGWNQIQFNLSDFTRRAYGTNFIETLRVQCPKVKFANQAKSVIELLYTLFTKKSFCESLVTDNGMQLKYHIKHINTTLYDPQCNRQVERFTITPKTLSNWHS
ncbi:hypothetical protein NDU88_002142 [Pleurodeles waltl]|uniref:CFA20 domain-containing protein n=1 Tax=Pleurodeles waltl TaxID=8319 RepID=A0AAV7KUR2_PLEWA|nr:hypothetical protein NDU88_002142 [Pleurodeles waltl]